MKKLQMLALQDILNVLSTIEGDDRENRNIIRTLCREDSITKESKEEVYKDSYNGKIPEALRIIQARVEALKESLSEA